MPNSSWHISRICTYHMWPSINCPSRTDLECMMEPSSPSRFLSRLRGLASGVSGVSIGMGWCRDGRHHMLKASFTATVPCIFILSSLILFVKAALMCFALRIAWSFLKLAKLAYLTFDVLQIRPRPFLLTGTFPLHCQVVTSFRGHAPATDTSSAGATRIDSNWFDGWQIWWLNWYIYHEIMFPSFFFFEFTFQLI